MKPSAGAPPLARILAMAFRTLVDELHERLEERGYENIRPAFGFVLLAARASPTTVNDVADLMGMTKQAASKLLASMSDEDLIRLDPHPRDARARLVALTPRGRRLLAEVEKIYARQEARWAEVVGRDRVESIRADLLRILRTEHGGELPAVKPTW